MAVCVNPEKFSHENLTGLSTSPVGCSHLTVGNPKVIFNSIIHTYIMDVFYNTSVCGLQRGDGEGMLTDRCKTAFVCLAVSTTCVTGLAADLTD